MYSQPLRCWQSPCQKEHLIKHLLHNVKQRLKSSSILFVNTVAHCYKPCLLGDCMVLCANILFLIWSICVLCLPLQYAIIVVNITYVYGCPLGGICGNQSSPGDFRNRKVSSYICVNKLHRPSCLFKLKIQYYIIRYTLPDIRSQTRTWKTLNVC